MKKLLVIFGLFMALVLPANATKVPENVRNFVMEEYPETVFRFDGVVVLPDGTVYLPLIPSQFNTDEPVEIKYTIPAGKNLAMKPDAIVLSNDYVLLKLLKNDKGKNTVINLPAPPVELVTGLFPQDMLVPKNFVLPLSLKNISGNLDMQLEKVNGLVIPVSQPKKAYINSLESVPVLKNKVMYVASNLSKNIQVVDTAKGNPSYALAQEEIPISIKGYDVFLLVTSYGKRSLDVISLNDDKVIKEIDFKTQPDEIVLDEKNKLAYISSGESASIYVISLETMTLKRQLRINGLCEKLKLSDDGTKLFYNDKQTREIWAVELDNNYLMKLVGKFPNVSKIEYLDGKIYITSRTKNRLAIIDYDSMGLMSENQISSKPVDMVSYKGNLFVLCAGDRVLDIIDTSVDSSAGKIELENTFPTRITQIGDSNIAVITDAMGGLYSILDMDKKEIIKTNRLDIPVNAVYITNVVKKIGSK